VVAAGHDRHGGRSGGTAWCPGRARAPAAPGIPTAARRRAPARSPAGQLGRRGRAGPDCGGTMPARHSSGADRLRSRPPSLDPVQPEHLGRIGAVAHRPPARVSNVALAAGRLVPPRADAWPRPPGPARCSSRFPSRTDLRRCPRLRPGMPGRCHLAPRTTPTSLLALENSSAHSTYSPPAALGPFHPHRSHQDGEQPERRLRFSIVTVAE
jgi:hypothetical protein